MGGKRGAPIYAVEAGRINRTKKQSNGALQIVLRGKSGSMLYYGHMDKVLIKGGQKVKRGQLIGRMGDSGSPGQVHLHFEYWKSGGESAAVNPIKFLKKPVRAFSPRFADPLVACQLMLTTQIQMMEVQC